MDPTRRFAAVLSAPEVRLDLAAALIAAHARPSLDVDRLVGRLDALATGVRGLDGLLRRLFVDFGLTGNGADYYDPRNSYLDQVLVRRMGIPISLSVVLLEVGRRVGVPLVGVGLPTHFVVGVADGSGRYVDAFAGGTLLDRAGLDRALAPMLGRPVDERELAPVAPLEIVDRMLRNLAVIFRRDHDLAGLRWCAELQTLVPGAPPQASVAFAAVLEVSGRHDRAGDVLERAFPDAANRPDPVRHQLTRLRAHRN